MKLFQICNQRELSHALIINKKKKHTSKILIWSQNNICGTTVGRIIHSNLLLGDWEQVEFSFCSYEGLHDVQGSNEFAKTKTCTWIAVARNASGAYRTPANIQDRVHFKNSGF